MSEIETEAQRILETLSSIPFENCYPLSRGFLDIPTSPGLYAVRHRTEEILYIGLATKLRRRFRDGHKAFFWAFLDYYSPDDIRISAVGITSERFDLQNLRRMEDLETLMIRIAHPRYNSLIK
jgi:hypothetical protein